MKLDLILGASGSGKSAEILARVRSLLDSGRDFSGNICDKIIILVPDQYTVTTEKFYINALGEEAMPYLKILSIKRLASFMFTEFCPADRGFVSGGGRNALMMKAVHTVAHQFSYYPPDRINPRFMTLLGNVASDLKQSLIDPGTLSRIAALENDPKLRDIALCYEAYCSYMEMGSFDEADILSVFGELVSSRRLFASSLIFCESFRLFTPQEMKVLEALLLSGADLTVSLPSENLSEKSLSLFSVSGECVRRLRGIASRCGIEPNIKILTDSKRYESHGLEFLQEHFFREDSGTFPEETADIRIYKANDSYDEVEYVACAIAELVEDKGYDYSDIMVVARDMELYASVLEPVFDRYGIPLFYHKKTPLKKKSVILLIRSLFDAVINGLSRETALDILKTGLTGVSVEDIALFEDYTLQWGLGYDRLLRDFTLSVRGFSEGEDGEEDIALLERINVARRVIADIISFFKEEISRCGYTVKGFSESLYSVFNRIDLPRKLAALEDEYRAYGEEELAAEQKQVYELVIDSLDEFVTTSGDDTVTAEEYSEILASVIESGNIGIIPVFANAVVAGGAETTPYASPRVIFAIGLMNGVFPKTDTSVSILDSRDKLILEKYDLSLGRSDTDKILYERFLAYYTVSAPSEKLYLCYNVGGADSAPSSVVTEIKKLFPMLEEETYPGMDDGEALLSRFRNMDTAYEMCRKFGITSLDGYFEKRGYVQDGSLPSTNLSAEVAVQLFGRNQTLSSSRVEKFYKCGFSYFIRYGMGLVRKRVAKLGALEAGNLIHSALNHVLSTCLTGTDDEIKKELDIFTAAYLKAFFGEELPPIAQVKHFEALVRRIFRLLKMFREELLVTKFRPVANELEVSFQSGVRPVRIPYKDGYVTMVGKIDRVDVYERDGTKFVRVIDYKSGKNVFSLEDLYYGLDIQMLAYLYALKENGSGFFDSVPEPAGCMYVNVNPVTISVERGSSPEKIEKEIRSNRKRSGLFLNDPDVLRAMDPEREGKYIPVKESDLKSLATAEQFGKLFVRVQSLLRKVAEETVSGRITKNPVYYKRNISCDYCDYALYCEREGKARQLSAVTCDNIYELIDEEGRNEP